MRTKRKSKWFALISVGLLMVVFPNFIEHISSWHISESIKSVVMVLGIVLEIIGVILISKEIKQNRQH